jgi:uncharacterized repeat protein (TIGR03803 family)
MEKGIKESFVLPVLVAALGLVLAGQVSAQTLRTVYGFTGLSFDSSTNSDGAYLSSLISSGNILYGTAAEGGTGGNGTVFKLNADGTGFSTLHSFAESSTNSSGIYTNYDGAGPQGSLVLSSNTLYGTASHGGSSGNGTVFKVNADGTGFKVLHNFTAGSGSFPNLTNSDGANPSTALILSGNTLYGTTYDGGSSGSGTVFAIHTDGTGFTILHDFTPSTTSYFTNTDGAYPNTGLVLSNDTLYGSTSSGGKSNLGTMFKLNTESTGFTTLSDRGNVDGWIFSGNTLYGIEVDSFGGFAAVYKVNPDRTIFSQMLYSQLFPASGWFTWGRFLQSGDTLYCTTSMTDSSLGFAVSSYRLLAIKTDGTGFTVLDGCEEAGLDGACWHIDPVLAVSDNNVYGIGNEGRFSSDLILGLSFAPELTITASASNIVLSWPTNYSGFDYTGYRLQSTTNLGSPVWTTNLAGPAVLNGQCVVTNTISGALQFFRLNQ